MKPDHNAPIESTFWGILRLEEIVYWYSLSHTVTVFMLAVAIYAWTHPNGDFKKLSTAYDPDAKGCGLITRIILSSTSHLLMQTYKIDYLSHYG